MDRWKESGQVDGTWTDRCDEDTWMGRGQTGGWDVDRWMARGQVDAHGQVDWTWTGGWHVDMWVAVGKVDGTWTE